MSEKMTVDQLKEMFRSSAKETTNPKHPEKIKLTVPTEVVGKAMESLGVDRVSLLNMGEATLDVMRAMHHLCSDKIREDILKNKDNKEFLSKVSVTGRGEIIPRYMRATVEVNGERRGTTIPREGQPSKEYVNWGTSRACIEITSALNEQREKDAKAIEESYKSLNK